MSQIKLKHSDGNSSIIAAPSSNPASDVTFRLPNADGSSGQVLKTDGSGNLGWATDQGGKTLQVVQAVKSDTATFTTQSFTDITGLSASITPASTGSKILIEASIFASTGGNVAMFNIVRGSTNIAQPSGSATYSGTMHSYVGSNSMHSMNLSFLDSPNTTSSTTYKIQVRSSNLLLVAINRYNGSDDYHAISTLTLTEVAA